VRRRSSAQLRETLRVRAQCAPFKPHLTGEERMRAVVWKGPGKVSVEQVDDPRVESATDVLVRITTARRGVEGFYTLTVRPP
jgi:Alcohol dehydrogenase GroES-associated